MNSVLCCMVCLAYDGSKLCFPGFSPQWQHNFSVRVLILVILFLFFLYVICIHVLVLVFIILIFHVLFYVVISIFYVLVVVVISAFHVLVAFLVRRVFLYVISTVLFRVIFALRLNFVLSVQYYFYYECLCIKAEIFSQK